MKNEKLWYAIILGFVGFVTSFGAHIVAVNLPFYAERIGVGVAVIGLLIAAYDLAEIIAKPIFGAVADRQGMKRTMLAGILVFTLASLSYLFVDPRLLVLVRFLQGVGAAALSAVSLALIGVYYQQHRGRAYGLYNAIKGLGYVVSPLVGGAIILASNFAMIFLAAADEDQLSLRSFLAVFREPVLMPWYVVTVVNMFFVGIIFGFFPVRIHALGYGPLQAGVLLSMVTVSYLVVQPVAGILADRLNPDQTIRLGLLLAAVSILVYPFVDGIILIVASILAGLGVGTVWTNTDTMISQLAKAGSLGATMGAAGSFKEFGDMIGPLLVGVLSQVLGLQVGFAICGLLGLIVLALITRGRRSQAIPQSTTDKSSSA